jgi:hypothetical protein
MSRDKEFLSKFLGIDESMEARVTPSAASRYSFARVTFELERIALEY